MSHEPNQCLARCYKADKVVQSFIMTVGLFLINLTKLIKALSQARRVDCVVQTVN